MALRAFRNGEEVQLSPSLSRIIVPRDAAKVFRLVCKESKKDPGVLLIEMLKSYVKKERLGIKLEDEA